MVYNCWLALVDLVMLFVGFFPSFGCGKYRIWKYYRCGLLSVLAQVANAYFLISKYNCEYH